MDFHERNLQLSAPNMKTQIVSHIPLSLAARKTVQTDFITPAISRVNLIDTFEETKEKATIIVYYLDPEEKESILLYGKSKVQIATHQVSLLILENGDY